MTSNGARATHVRTYARITALLPVLVGVMLTTSCGGTEPEPVEGSVSRPDIVIGACQDTYCSEQHEGVGFCPAECDAYECFCCGDNPMPWCDPGDGGGEEPPYCPRSTDSVLRKLYYEGSCNFLARCSAPTRQCLADRRCRPGEVLWGYCGIQACNAYSGAHVAAPDGFSCGQVVEFCRVDNPCICAAGVIVDRSDRNVWEAGPAVFDQLGQSRREPTLGCSGGAGEVQVFVRILN